MKPGDAAKKAAHELSSRLGERLHSVVLYGSAARDEFVDARSDINLLVLLDRIDPGALRRLSEASAQWGEKRINAMLLEDREWTRASDAFAVEVMDMKDARVVLHGTDPVENLSIDWADARLQAERELRGRIITLHNGMVRHADQPAELGALLVAALPSFATYLRTALRLSDRPAPSTLREVIEGGTRLVEASGDGLLRALVAREKGGPWHVDLEGDVVHSYNAAVERTARFVDSLAGR